MSLVRLSTGMYHICLQNMRPWSWDRYGYNPASYLDHSCFFFFQTQAPEPTLVTTPMLLQPSSVATSKSRLLILHCWPVGASGSPILYAPLASGIVPSSICPSLTHLHQIYLVTPLHSPVQNALLHSFLVLIHQRCADNHRAGKGSRKRTGRREAWLYLYAVLHIMVCASLLKVSVKTDCKLSSSNIKLKGYLHLLALETTKFHCPNV